MDVLHSVWENHVDDTSIVEVILGSVIGLIGGIVKISGLNAKARIHLYKSLDVVHSSEELKARLKDSPQGLEYVIIDGVVKCSSPIQTKFANPPVPAVAYKFKVIEYTSERERSGNWYDHERVVSSIRDFSPFDIHFRNSSQGVSVPQLPDDGNIPFRVVYDVYDRNKRGVAATLADSLVGKEIKGARTIEEVVPLNMAIIGIGQLVVSSRGVELRASGTRPLVLSESLDALINKETDSYYTSDVVGSILLVIGLGLAAHSIYRVWRSHSREAEMRAFRNSSQNPSSNSTRNDDEMCLICYNHPKNALLLECGHLCCCMTCASSLTTCPVCRAHVDRIVQAYS